MAKISSRTRFVAVALLLTTLLASACGQSKLPKIGGGKDETTKRLISSTGAFEMKVPESWQQASNLNDVAVLQAANRTAEAYALLIADPKGPFEGIPLQDFADAQVKKFQESLASPQDSGPEKVTIDGKQALQFQIEGTAEDVEVVYLYTFIETDDNFLKVLTWSLAENFDDNKNKLADVTSSVRQLKATGEATEQGPGESPSPDAVAPEVDPPASPEPSPAA